MNMIHNIKLFKPYWIILLATLVLGSCKVTENYKSPTNMVDLRLFRDVDTTDSLNIGELSWKEFFRDTLLQHLIEEGIQNNPDMKIALDRIKQAQANFRQSNAAFFPTMNVNANGPVVRSSNLNNTFSLYQLYGSASWEADIWGKLRNTKRAALAALLESEAYKRAVQTQLVANITTYYFALMAYDAQLNVTQKTVENRKLDVEIMNKLKESDVVTGAAVVQSEANRYSVEVTIPDLKQTIRVFENTLSILLGRSPGIIARDSLNHQQGWSRLQTGVPLQLLANRPDVQQAEYQLRYYFELSKVAKTYFYPTLTITAEGGLANGNLSKLFDPVSWFGYVLAGIVQPVFNHGQNIQRLNVAKAQEEESLETFRKTLLNAGLEVSNALSNYQSATEKLKIREQQIHYLQKSVEYTEELLKYSAHTNYTDVLTSEQSLLAAQLNSVSDKVQQLQAVIALYRSLGGGWR
ncbi:MAG: efflux transporter outer membrane subunit [Paludibacter sp.]|nr:efflux transporter outer membrane subunit [Paludibacter sp.]